MKIDLEHLHFYMCAIRESSDPIRTLDAFWKGQIQSKTWLVEELTKYVTKPATIDIHGGWVGTLASLIFQSDIPVKHITSVDIDPTVEQVATMMNKIEEMDGRFKAITKDMLITPVHSDIVINTCCEHLTQEQYNIWLENIPESSLIVLQSNDYRIPEHVRIATTMQDFENQSNLKIKYLGTKRLPQYNRFMLIGTKNV